MQILLEDEGYEVITTMDGSNVEKLYGQKPDLVFFDIWMSGIHGSTICQTLKAKDTTKHIPVVMFSANRDTEEIAMQCGADGFLSKPFDIKELLDIVHKHLVLLHEYEILKACIL